LNKMLGLIYDAWAAVAMQNGEETIPKFWTHYYPRERQLGIGGNVDFFSELLDAGIVYRNICGPGDQERSNKPSQPPLCYKAPRTRLPWWVNSNAMDDWKYDLYIWAGGTTVLTATVLSGSYFAGAFSGSSTTIGSSAATGATEVVTGTGVTAACGEAITGGACYELAAGIGGSIILMNTGER
jgi:hypothetical protein